MINTTMSASATGISPLQHTSYQQRDKDSQAATINPLVARSVSISEEARHLERSDSVFRMATGSGNRNIDLSTFFDIKTDRANLLDTSNLLLPSIENVESLSAYIAQVFPGFLSKHDIPESPEHITFDNTGALVLPLDYPHTEQLKAALDGDRGMMDALRTTHAIASHVAAIQATEPMTKEMAQAETETEMAQLMMKYAHFLGENRSNAYPKVSLEFSPEGAPRVTTDDGVSLV